mgnify:CR=1 FL=1
MRTKDFSKQQRIKDAMISLILKEGINGASVAKIARKARVSPATIYVYYANKEDMLSEVFNEYAQKCYFYLNTRLSEKMSGKDLIETLVRGTYVFALENEEVFSFVEQCYSCPTLQETISQRDCRNNVFKLIHDFQNKGIIRNCSDPNLSAVLFAPVKFMAMNRQIYPDPDRGLEELIGMLQDLLLY